jgi:hypothetical protein
VKRRRKKLDQSPKSPPGRGLPGGLRKPSAVWCQGRSPGALTGSLAQLASASGRAARLRLSARRVTRGPGKRGDAGLVGGMAHPMVAEQASLRRRGASGPGLETVMIIV